jgi:hypothetical protein
MGVTRMLLYLISNASILQWVERRVRGTASLDAGTLVILDARPRELSDLGDEARTSFGLSKREGYWAAQAACADVALVNDKSGVLTVACAQLDDSARQ